GLTNFASPSSALSAGNVGIGTTSPATLFEVGGSSNNVTFDGYLNCTGFTTNANGKLICTASDMRLKQDITSLDATSSLAAIDKLNPVSFDWRPETGRGSVKQLGLIAQEVQAVFPNLVQVTNPTGLTPDGTRVVNYVGLIAPMIKSIQAIDSRFSLPSVATSTPSAILSEDGKSLDLYKLATYSTSGMSALADKINAQDIRLTSLESRVAALESGSVNAGSGPAVSFSSSTLASALQGFGALIQKGVAQFNTLVFRQLVASTDANGDSSAGSGTIKAGDTEIVVNNALVTPTTKVFVTFNAQVAGSWWVSDKKAGSFKVVLSAVQGSDVSFDYLLVQTQGQLATPAADGSFPSASGSAGPDTVPPVITILGDNPVHVSVGGTFVEPGITVTDAVDGTDPYITFINGTQQAVSAATIDTSAPTTYLITYKATDAAGNSSTAMRSVIV
ncbi:MAG: hypothetical protein B7W98_02430, partial [Parcubacteria group bacterium 20-58-5]